MRQPGDRAPAPAPLTLAQDLANTVDIELGHDELDTVAGLATFAEAHGLTGLTFTPQEVAACVEFREALREVCLGHAGHEVPAATGLRLEAAFATAPLVLQLDRSGSARFVPMAGTSGLATLVARVAAGIGVAVVDRTWPRLKACASEECRWVYYDRSPAGRSRWCTMSLCGSRAKMRAYRGRKP